MGIDVTSTTASRIRADDLGLFTGSELTERVSDLYERNKNGGAIMKKNLFISIVAILIGGFFASPLVADSNHDRKRDDILVKFKGGIGVIPISNVALDATTGAVIITRNMVRGVNSPGQIWRIKDLEAKIKNNGDIKVEGEGLLLAGGNNIGTNAGQSVAAQLFCGDQTFTSPGVALEANGDFKITGVLSPLPLPGICETPVLLIRSINLTTGVLGSWFAAGIPDLDDHDRR
jgi:hypothetical protein